MARRIKPKFQNLAALLSALDEGAMTRGEVDQCLDAVRMGIGLSKRDKALATVLEQSNEPKDKPEWWDGFRAGMVQGYEGARLEIEGGGKLRPVAEIAAEAEAEARGEVKAN